MEVVLCHSVLSPMMIRLALKLTFASSFRSSTLPSLSWKEWRPSKTEKTRRPCFAIVRRHPQPLTRPGNKKGHEYLYCELATVGALPVALLRHGESCERGESISSKCLVCLAHGRMTTKSAKTLLLLFTSFHIILAKPSEAHHQRSWDLLLLLTCWLEEDSCSRTSVICGSGAD